MHVQESSNKELKKDTKIFDREENNAYISSKFCAAVAYLGSPGPFSIRRATRVVPINLIP